MQSMSSQRSLMSDQSRRLWLLPAALLLIFVGMTIGIWRLQRAREIEAAHAEAAAYREDFGRRLTATLQDKLTPLQWRWLSGQLGSPVNFVDEATDLLAADPQYGFIAWVDNAEICQDVRGSGENKPQPGENVFSDPLWSDLISRARQYGNATVSPVRIDRQFGPVVCVALPGLDGGNNGPSDGAILFQFRLEPILNSLIDPSLSKRISLQLIDLDQPFFSLQSPATAVMDASAEWEPVQFVDREWSLRAEPSSQLLAEHLSIIPGWAVWLWIVGALLLVGSAYQMAHYRRANNRRLTHYLDALEKVAQTSAAIIGRIGSSGDVWHLIPTAACTFTGANNSCVAVLEEDGLNIRLLAVAGLEPELVGTLMPLASVPSVERCIATRQIVSISDTRHSNVPFNRTHADRYHVRSFLHVPLIVQDKMIGVMMVGSTIPNCFDESAQRLAELWGMLAAVTISNERMYEQMSRALAARDRLMRQRDALFDVNASIASERSAEDILTRIVEIAASPLGVDVCQVVLLDSATGEMVVAATTPPWDSLVRGFRYRAEGSNPNEAMRLRQPIVVENGPSDPRSQPFLKSVLPCGSIMHMPLLASSGKPIGVLVMLRKDPGGFSEEQIYLAQLFAARAAVAIENAQLYQQSVRDAQTQAMLLRELAHRVKNSLSGIVALLSIDQPPMSAQARQWVSRVTDRIRTMARTHEMLTAGTMRGSVRELIDSTLQSLALVTARGVLPRSEQVGGDVQLRADRSVSVAMILHELCYNALVHGLADGGTLTVRSSKMPDQSLMIEVVDSGRGFVEGEEGRMTDWTDRGGEGASRAAVLGAVRTGLGLNLVRDFVSRELRGQFSIESTPGRGTTARIQFPLLEEELGHPV